MIRQVVLFPFRLAFAVGCVVVILAAAPVLALLGHKRDDEAP